MVHTNPAESGRWCWNKSQRRNRGTPPQPCAAACPRTGQKHFQSKMPRIGQNLRQFATIRLILSQNLLTLPAEHKVQSDSATRPVWSEYLSTSNRSTSPLSSAVLDVMEPSSGLMVPLSGAHRRRRQQKSGEKKRGTLGDKWPSKTSAAAELQRSGRVRPRRAVLAGRGIVAPDRIEPRAGFARDAGAGERRPSLQAVLSLRAREAVTGSGVAFGCCVGSRGAIDARVGTDASCLVVVRASRAWRAHVVAKGVRVRTSGARTGNAVRVAAAGAPLAVVNGSDGAHVGARQTHIV